MGTAHQGQLMAHMGRKSLLSFFFCIFQYSGQCVSNAGAHLGSGCFGKSKDKQTGNVYRVFHIADHADNTFDQYRCFPASCSSRKQKIPVTGSDG